MCKSALKFLRKCCSSGFVMPPFHHTDLKKKSSHRRSGIFCSTCKLIFIKNRKPAAFCILRVIVPHQTSCLPKKNTRIKCRFALVKNLWENAEKYLTLFCAYWEHWFWQSSYICTGSVLHLYNITSRTTISNISVLSAHLH